KARKRHGCVRGSLRLLEGLEGHLHPIREPPPEHIATALAPAVQGLAVRKIWHGNDDRGVIRPVQWACFMPQYLPMAKPLQAACRSFWHWSWLLPDSRHWAAASCAAAMARWRSMSTLLSWLEW